MHRVLGNLVRNARQSIMASGIQGEVIVTATQTQAAWLISVSDTGPGLPGKAQEHLFLPFKGPSGREALALG